MNRALAAELRKDFTLHVALRPDGSARLCGTNGRVAVVSIETQPAFAFDEHTTAEQVKQRADTWVSAFLRTAVEPFRSVGMIRAEAARRSVFTVTVPEGGTTPEVARGGPSSWSPEVALAASDLLTMLASLRVWPEVAVQIERDRAGLRG